MTLEPPRVATWFLVRLASGPGRESLIGDLIERHHEKRSTTWSWGQVLVAVAITNATEIWNHRTLALRAVVVGWSATYVFGWMSGMLLAAALPSVFLFHGTADSVLPFLFNSAVLIGHVRTSVVRVCTGWLVARCHRQYQTSMVFAFLSSFLILDLPWLFRRAIDAAAIGQAPIVATFIHHLVSAIITVVAVMVGLMLGSKDTNNSTASPETVGA